MRSWLKIALAASFLALAASVAGYAWTHPTLLQVRYDLRLATGPIGSDGQKLLAAFIRDLATERPLVRLIPVPTTNSELSSDSLTSGQVDLAVLRSDDEAAA